MFNDTKIGSAIIMQEPIMCLNLLM